MSSESSLWRSKSQPHRTN